jgi:molybdopterin-containing oxidoreductase family iron-sulfur binding subunit
MMLFSSALDAFETVYGERALVDYDFQSFLLVSVGADFVMARWRV